MLRNESTSASASLDKLSSSTKHGLQGRELRYRKEKYEYSKQNHDQSIDYRRLDDLLCHLPLVAVGDD